MIGFANLTIERIREVFPDNDCVILDFSSNPAIKYNEIKHKNKKVFVVDIITAKYLANKFGRKLEGYFVIKDSFFNLKVNNIECVDVSSSGLTIIDYKNSIDLSSRVKQASKFSKKFVSDYKSNGYDLIVSSFLSKKKTECDTISELAEIFYNRAYKGKDYKELVCKAVTNNIDYKDLDTKDYKFSTRIRKFLIQHKVYSKAIIAFQDMMYNLTDIKTAIKDTAANEEKVQELLSMWNPKPKEKKSILFKFNKKPLPKNKRTKKRLERWAKQTNDIPKAIILKRKEVINKHKRKHLDEQEILMLEHASGIVSFNKFISFIEKETKLNSKDLYMLGATLPDGSLKLRKGTIVSVTKKNSNEIIYVRIV